MEVRRDGETKFDLSDGKGFRVRGSVKGGWGWEGEKHTTTIIKKNKEEEEEGGKRREGETNKEEEQEVKNNTNNNNNICTEWMKPSTPPTSSSSSPTPPPTPPSVLTSSGLRRLVRSGPEAWVGRLLPSWVLPCHYHVCALGAPSWYRVELEGEGNGEGVEGGEGGGRGGGEVGDVGGGRGVAVLGRRWRRGDEDRAKGDRREGGGDRQKNPISEEHVGLGHVENNWGERFPDGWIWAQGAVRTPQQFTTPTTPDIVSPPSPSTRWFHGLRYFFSSSHFGKNPKNLLPQKPINQPHQSLTPKTQKTQAKRKLEEEKEEEERSGSCRLILTGGLFDIRPFPRKCPALLGYRSPTIQWDFMTVCLDEVQFEASWRKR